MPTTTTSALIRELSESARPATREDAIEQDEDQEERDVCQHE